MQGVDTDQTIRQMIFAYKGATSCAQERGDFVLCRATPAGRLGDPELCEGKVASFLQCYHDMVKESNANCQTQFKNIYGCMKANLSGDQPSDVPCIEMLEEFAKCKQ
eukprot:403371629